MYMSGCVQGFSGPAGGDSTLIDHGDPELVNVVPAGQYLSAYSFYADPSYRDTSLVVVRAKSRGAFHEVSIERAGAIGDFQPIGARGEYEFARVDLGTKGKPGQTSDAGVYGAPPDAERRSLHGDALGLGPRGELRVPGRPRAAEARVDPARADPVVLTGDDGRRGAP